ncbi:hypothetical protein AABB24_039486, partial [Solanum stoloniferum]
IVRANYIATQIISNKCYNSKNHNTKLNMQTIKITSFENPHVLSMEELKFLLKKYDRTGGRRLNRLEFMDAIRFWFYGCRRYQSMNHHHYHKKQLDDDDNDDDRRPIHTCNNNDHEIYSLLELSTKMGYTFM